VNTTLDPSLVAELDEWLGRQPYKVSRAAFIEAAVKRLLAEEKSKEKKR
jgi:metal-responsive CopG/Arc/MetJ family transcriptional regulator